MKKLILLSLLCFLLIPLFSFAANDGAPVGSLTFDSPKYGSASVAFDGNSYIVVPDNASLNFGANDFTLELWFKTTNPGTSGGQNLLGEGVSTTSGYYEMGTYGNTIGKPYLYIIDNLNHDVWLEGSTNVSDGVWHFLDIVRRGTTFELWVDAGLVSSDSNSLFDSVGVPADFFIGSGAGGPFTGLIDEVAVYNFALSPETISNHYGSTNYQSDVSNTSGLVSYWRLDNNYLDAPVLSGSPTESELLQQIKDVLDQIDTKTQAIQEVTAGSTAVDWNKTMSFVVGTLSSLAFVFASRMIL